MKHNFGTPLSRSEMKHVLGGKQQCECKCGGTMPGDWVYTSGDGQPSNSYLHNDITTYCGTAGGSCTGCTNWAA